MFRMRTLYYVLSSVMGSIIALVGAYFVSLREFDRQVILQDQKATIRSFARLSNELRQRAVSLKNALRDGTAVAVLEQKRQAYNTAYVSLQSELSNFELTVKDLLERDQIAKERSIFGEVQALAGMAPSRRRRNRELVRLREILNSELRPGWAHVDTCLTAGVKHALRTVRSRGGGATEMSNSIESLERIKVPVDKCTERVPIRLKYCLMTLTADLLSTVFRREQPTRRDLVAQNVGDQGIRAGGDDLDPFRRYEQNVLLQACSIHRFDTGIPAGQVVEEAGSLVKAGLRETD